MRQARKRRPRRSSMRAAAALASGAAILVAFISATSPVAGAAFSTQTTTAGGGLSTVTIPTPSPITPSLDPQWYGQPFTSQLGTNAFGSPEEEGFGQISCPTASDCVVVDQNNSSDYVDNMYFVTTDAQNGPNATWIGGNFGSSVPKAVSCESTTLCYIAVQDNSSSADGVEASFNAFDGSGGTWSPEIAYSNTSGTSENGLPYGTPTSITCFDPAGCTLVTTNGYECTDTSANVATGMGAWGCADIAGSNDLTSVSCAAGGPTITCAMTDSNGDLYTGEPWSGSVAEISTPYGAWGGVDCADYFHCYAYGSVIDTWEQWNLTWTPENVSPGNSITALSCVSDSECVAGTFYGNSLVTVNANDGQSGTARWYSAPDNTTVSGGVELGMSCPTVYNCYESIGYTSPIDPPFAAVFTTPDAVQMYLAWTGSAAYDYNGNQIVAGSTLAWTNSSSGSVGVPGVNPTANFGYNILLTESEEPASSGNTFAAGLFAVFGGNNDWYSAPDAVCNPWSVVSAPT